MCLRPRHVTVSCLAAKTKNMAAIPFISSEKCNILRKVL